MRGKSHIFLGNYLIDHYLPDLSGAKRQIFLLGCIQPDRNPATYLKGSLQWGWLRGHHYRNARRFMARISRRLERKDAFSLFDYYTLGKLIHYTADAFTYPHNDSFPDSLLGHRSYEVRLQEHFLAYLAEDPQVDVRLARTVMDVISSCHLTYTRQRPDLNRDCRYALQACCCVLAVLAAPKLV